MAEPSLQRRLLEAAGCTTAAEARLLFAAAQGQALHGLWDAARRAIRRGRLRPTAALPGEATWRQRSGWEDSGSLVDSLLRRGQWAAAAAAVPRGALPQWWRTIVAAARPHGAEWAVSLALLRRAPGAGVHPASLLMAVRALDAGPAPGASVDVVVSMDGPDDGAAVELVVRAARIAAAGHHSHRVAGVGLLGDAQRLPRHTLRAAFDVAVSLDQWAEALHIAQEAMVPRGVYPAPHDTNRLVLQLERRGLATAAARFAGAVASAQGTALLATARGGDCGGPLRAALRARQWKQALLALSHDGATAHRADLGEVVRLCAHAQSWAAAASLLTSRRSPGLSPELLSAVAACFASKARWREGALLLRHFAAFATPGSAPDPRHHLAQLRACRASGAWRCALHVLGQLQCHGAIVPFAALSEAVGACVAGGLALRHVYVWLRLATEQGPAPGLLVASNDPHVPVPHSADSPASHAVFLAVLQAEGRQSQAKAGTAWRRCLALLGCVLRQRSDGASKATADVFGVATELCVRGGQWQRAFAALSLQRLLGHPVGRHPAHMLMQAALAASPALWLTALRVAHIAAAGQQADHLVRAGVVAALCAGDQWEAALRAAALHGVASDHAWERVFLCEETPPAVAAAVAGRLSTFPVSRGHVLGQRAMGVALQLVAEHSAGWAAAVSRLMGLLRP